LLMEESGSGTLMFTVYKNSAGPGIEQCTIIHLSCKIKFRTLHFDPKSAGLLFSLKARLRHTEL
jgi:hypothetical protein